ncbi:MAG: co-chaperone DjlA [Legionellales bacterium]|nr:co-chaperone DjlA [Legionellales bacterium]
MVWVGKIIGSIFGYLLLGNPAGALIGLLVGNLFDRGFKLNRLLGIEAASRGVNESVHSLWLQTLFQVMGHLAKLDGRVTETNIEAANRLMRSLGLNSQERKQAIDDFNRGKQSSFKLYRSVQQLHSSCQTQRSLLKSFIEQQYQVAMSDGVLSLKKRNVLASICRQLGFEPLIADMHYQQQQRQQQSQYQHRSSYSHQKKSYQSHQRTNYSSQNSGLNSEFKVLGLAETATNAQIKNAYRKLISQYHPDKMMGKKLPDEMVSFATEKTRVIRKAYEKIRTARGF